MQTNSSALRCCGEEEEEESGLAHLEQGRPPLIIAAQFPICPLGPVGGMNLDRVVGRWELAAAARVLVGPSDKKPGQTKPGHGPARRIASRARAGGAARLGGGGACVWPPGSPSQLVYVRVLRLTI